MSSEHPSPGPISSSGHVLRGKQHGASTGVGLEDAELAQLVELVRAELGECMGLVSQQSTTSQNRDQVLSSGSFHSQVS